MQASQQTQHAILAPVSTGELLDKISILKIKADRIADPAKHALVERELALLTDLMADQVPAVPAIEQLCEELRQVNEALWDIEDAIRIKEKNGAFDEEFIALARSVYRTNDRRAALKRALNDALGSEIVEVKDYA